MAVPCTAHTSTRAASSAARIVSGLAGFFVLTHAAPARAADVELDHLAKGAIKLDGKNKEWPGTTPADVTIKAGKLKATFNAGYDDTGFWVGAEIEKDGSIVRTSSFGDGEDRVMLSIAFPKSGVASGVPEYTAYDVDLFAGVPGLSSGAVKMHGGKSIDGATIIEAPRKTGGGYTLEAFIPWSAFPEAKKTRAGLRGALRAYDADTSGIRSIKGTSAATADDPKKLGFLLIEPEQSLPQAFAAKKSAWKDVLYDVNADLSGDGLNERVIFVGRSLYLLGPTYKEGKQWLNMDLGADVVGLDAKDVTFDGHQELLVTMRVKAPSSTREALHVYALSGEKGAEKPTQIFSHETLVDGGGKTLRDLVVFGGTKAKPLVTIDYQPPKGWDASNWDQPTASDVDAILLPWGSVKQRIFAFDSKAAAFVKDKETLQKAVAVATTTTSEVGKPKNEPPPPLPKGDPALLALTQFKKDKGLGDVTPRFERVVAIGGGKKGRAALFGRELVVTAADGTYAYVTMSRFASDADILEVSTVDLSTDGRDEIVVRGVARAKLTGGSGGDQEVLRELLTVYAPTKGASGITLPAVFTAEVARSIADKRVESAVKISPASGATSGAIELGKGTAKGWTATTYPFGKEGPTPGVEPLVLPWSSSGATYKWSGDKLVKQ